MERALISSMTLVRDGYNYSARAFDLRSELSDFADSSSLDNKELPQNDLYEKAKDDILDDISSLHKLTPLEWETLLQESLWEKIHSKVVDDIYLAAAESTSPSHFNTKVLYRSTVPPNIN